MEVQTKYLEPKNVVLLSQYFQQEAEASKLPDLLKLPAPAFGYHVQIFCRVGPKNKLAVDLGPRPNPVLKPLRNPGVHVRARLGGPDANLTARIHAIDLEQCNVRNPQACIYG